MSLSAIGGVGTETSSYTSSLLGGWNKPGNEGTASAIRGRRPEDQIGAMLSSGNVTPQFDK